MSVLRWFAIWLGRPRPVATPTAISLAVAVCLLGIALLVPDRRGGEASAATEVQRVAVAPVRPQQKVSLRDRLVVGLQARLNSEVDFVEDVALRVQAGELPQRIVDETFFWARERGAVPRRGRTRRPILFFQPAMRARAERIGVEL